MVYFLHLALGYAIFVANMKPQKDRHLRLFFKHKGVSVKIICAEVNVCRVSFKLVLM
jgi:hypothetical protein